MSFASNNSKKIQRILKGSILIGIFSFVFAILIGIWRIALTRGFILPSIPEFLPPHGNLMIGAFLGTLIIFERMFALPVKWLIWTPYIWGISSALIHIDFPLFKILNIVALLGWGIHRFIAYKTFKHLLNPLIEFLSYVALSIALLSHGGLAGSIESALAGFSFAIAVIGAERIELTLGFNRTSAKVLYLSLIVYLGISIINSLFYLIPVQIVGIILLFVSIGLIYNDSVIIVYVKGFALAQGALHKFARETLIVAYLWLIFASISIILWNQIQAVAKDVVFHSIGLGFIFTMILSHAPIVLGSTLGKMPKRIPSRILFYLFQLMTIVRVFTDLFVTVSVELWSWAGWITGTLHFIFFILYILSVLRSFK